VDIPGIIREKILEIGYDSSIKGYDGASCGVSVSIGSQSPDIAQGVQHAFGVLEALPKEQRISVVTDWLGTPYKSVPAVDQIKPAVREFRQFLQMETTA